VASLSQGRTAAAQCGLFTHKSVPVIFEPPCTKKMAVRNSEVISHIFHADIILWSRKFVDQLGDC